MNDATMVAPDPKEQNHKLEEMERSIDGDNEDGKSSDPDVSPADISNLVGERGDDDLSLSGSDDEGEMDYFDIKHHPSYRQVMLDVNRCAGRLEHIRQCYFHRTDDDEVPEDLTADLEKQRLGHETSDEDEESLNNNDDDIHDRQVKLERIYADLQHQKRLKKKLAKLIVRLLIRKPNLHYYQGFHDVCLTYMTLHGDGEAMSRLDRLIDTHFFAFMQPTMNETQEFLALIPIIIGLQDSKVQEYMDHAEVGTIFALSWVITWFSHVIPNEQDVETIFSHLESVNDPHLVLYLCAEIVLYKKVKLMELEPEMSTVHHFLCQVPRKEKLPVDELLEKSMRSFQKWPPTMVKEKLAKYRASLQMQNYNLIRNVAQQFVLPTLANFIGSPTSRRALVVFVVASALAFQFDRWMR